jgi:type II secretory pathway pseudopilin PulG
MTCTVGRLVPERTGRRMRSGNPANQGGFGWLVVLAALALASAGASVVAARWADETSRWREQELLRVGNLYARALAAYRQASPGSERRFPSELSQLLQDDRFVGTRRHLRELYPDPTTGRVDWVLVRDGRGDIEGLRSRSAATTWARVPLHLADTDLAAAQRTMDWTFRPREAAWGGR